MPADAFDFATFDGKRRSALMAFFRRRVRDYGEAEDLTQEVMVRVATRSGTGMAHPDAYVFQVAANLLRDRARREKVRSDYLSGRGQLDQTGVDVLDPQRRAIGREQLTLFVQALDALPERTRQIFLLFRYEHIDQRTIAESFGISSSAVEKCIHRAMAVLIAKTGGTD